MLNNKQLTTLIKHDSKIEKYKAAMLYAIKMEIEKIFRVLVKRNGGIFQNKSSENPPNFDWTGVSQQFQVKGSFFSLIFCGVTDLNCKVRKSYLL